MDLGPNSGRVPSTSPSWVPSVHTPLFIGTVKNQKSTRDPPQYPVTPPTGPSLVSSSKLNDEVPSLEGGPVRETWRGKQVTPVNTDGVSHFWSLFYVMSGPCHPRVLYPHEVLVLLVVGTTVQEGGIR